MSDKLELLVNLPLFGPVLQESNSFVGFSAIFVVYKCKPRWTHETIIRPVSTESQPNPHLKRQLPVISLQLLASHGRCTDMRHRSTKTRYAPKELFAQYKKRRQTTRRGVGRTTKYQENVAANNTK